LFPHLHVTLTPVVVRYPSHRHLPSQDKKHTDTCPLAAKTELELNILPSACRRHLNESQCSVRLKKKEQHTFINRSISPKQKTLPSSQVNFYHNRTTEEHLPVLLLPKSSHEPFFHFHQTDLTDPRSFRATLPSFFYTNKSSHDVFPLESLRCFGRPKTLADFFFRPVVLIPSFWMRFWPA
jgi:hypothetical protein